MNHRGHRDTEDNEESSPPLIPSRAALLIVVLAIGVIFAIVLAGVGDDFVNLAIPKKFVLSFSSVIAVLCVGLASIRRPGCAALAMLYTALILLSLVIMWNWN